MILCLSAATIAISAYGPLLLITLHGTSALVAGYIIAGWLARLEQAQRQRPNNAYLQYLAGQACMERQLWGKAAQLLGQASHGLKDAALLRRTWRSMAALAEERGDEAAAQQAWKKAALQD